MKNPLRFIVMFSFRLCSVDIFDSYYLIRSTSEVVEFPKYQLYNVTISSAFDGIVWVEAHKLTEIYLPELTFVTEKPIQIILPSSWSQLQEKPSRVCKINANNIIVCYETPNQIASNYFTFSTPPKYEYNIFKGNYNFIDLSTSSIDVPNLFICNFAGGKLYKCDFFPFENRLKFTIYSYKTKDQELFLDTLNFPDVSVEIISADGDTTHFVTFNEFICKDLIVNGVNFAVNNKFIVTGHAKISENSSLTTLEQTETQFNNIEILGTYSPFPTVVDVKNSITFYIEKTPGLIQCLTKSETREIICKFVSFPESIEWNDQCVNIQAKDASAVLDYSLYKTLTLNQMKGFDYFQTTLKFSGTNGFKSTKIFKYDLSCSEKSILLFSYDWYQLNPEISLQITSNTQIIVKTEGDFQINTDKFVIFPTPKILSDTSGKYCIIKSLTDFNHCEINDERVLIPNGNIINHNFWISQTKKFQNIYIKVINDCSFISDCLHKSKINFLGKQNEIKIKFSDDEKSSQFYFENLSVSFDSNTKISFQNLAFQNTEKVTFNCQTIDISDYLKCNDKILKEILSKMISKGDIEIVYDFGQNDTSVNLFSDTLQIENVNGNIDLSFFGTKQISFNILTKSDFVIKILAEKNKIIPRVFNVISKNDDQTVIFPTFTGDENYFSPKSKGKFISEKTKWTFKSNSHFLPENIFDFPEKSTKIVNPLNIYCFYSENESLCPDDSNKIKFDTNYIDSISKFDEVLFLVCETNSEKRLKLDKSVLSKKTVIKGLNQKEFVEFNQIENEKIVLEKIDIIVNEDFTSPHLQISGSKLEIIGKIKTQDIFTDYVSFDSFYKKLQNPVNISLVSNEIIQISYKKFSLKLNEIEFNQNFCSFLTILFTKPKSNSSPLVVTYDFDQNDDKIVTFPHKYSVNFDDDFYILFTDSWEDKNVSTKFPIYIDPVLKNKIYVLSNYDTFPSIFTFSNFVFEVLRSKYFCLTPDSNYKCSTHHKHIIYKKGEVINPEKIKLPEDSKIVTFSILESNDTFYPILPKMNFDEYDVTFNDFGTKVTQYISADFNKAKILTLHEVVLTQIENEKFVSEKLLFSTNSDLILKGKLVTNSIFVQEKSLHLLEILAEDFNNKLTFTSHKTTTISFNESGILFISGQRVFVTFSRIGIFDIIFTEELSLFIDYRGHRDVSLTSTPSMIFKENTAVTFSNRFSEYSVKTQRKGNIKGNIKVISEYQSLPDLFVLPPNVYPVLREKGYYCIYNSSLKYDFMKCPERLTLVDYDFEKIPIENFDKNDVSEIHLFTTKDITLNIENLDASLILSAYEKSTTFTIIGNSDKNLQNSIKIEDCKLKVKSEKLTLSHLTLNEFCDFGESKISVLKSISGPLKAVAELQNHLISRCSQTYVETTNSIYILKNDQIKLQNSVLLYEKLGSIRFTVSNEENLRIECGDKSLNIVPSFYIINQVCTVFFDKSVYSVSSFSMPGYIRVLSDGKKFVFKSNFNGPPEIFIIPDESNNVFYEFSKIPTPKTPSPTKIPQPEPNNSSFFLGMTLKQTICLLLIIVDVITIVALSSNLVYVYFYKFEEMIYPNRSSSLYSNEGLSLIDEL